MRFETKTWLAGAVVASALTLSVSTAQALPAQTVFTAAGLGNAANWSLIPSPSVWGSGGNGLFSSGGGATFELRLADLDHTFGTVGPNASGPFNIIFTSTGNSVGDTVSWVPISNPFAFFMQVQPTPGGSYVTSDGFTNNAALDLAIYRNNLNPDEFAFFFDDGGGLNAQGQPDDNDFNDMVVTAVQAAVPEPGTLALFGAGLAAVGFLRRRKSASL